MGETLSWDRTGTLVDAFASFTREFADLPAYTQSGQTISYARLRELSRRVAVWLMSRPDLQTGDRIAIQVPNILAYPVIAWGILQAGMVIVNLNPQYTLPETLRQLQDAGVKAWFCADIAAHLIEPVRSAFPIPHVVTCRLFELHPWPRKQVYQFVLRYRRKAIRPYSEHGMTSFSQILRQSSGRDWQKPPITAENLAMLQYTGGSSGVFMGAMLSHANLVANMEQVKAFLSEQGEHAREILVAPLPLFHIFSFTVHCAASLLTGCHNFLILDASHIKNVTLELRRVRFTMLTGVNTLFYALLRLESFKALDFRSLKFAIAGGMKLDPEVARKWEAITGTPILEGFGMTELSPVASWNPRTGNKLGTIGKALPHTEMQLRNEQGQVLTRPGDEGELWIRGPQVMVGYWRKPEETLRHKDAEGWMRTGDIASFDEEGYWRIVGRKKRMILVSGFNVYPDEVEKALLTHPEVTEALVVGKQHPVNGESVKAYVVSSNPALSTPLIRDYLKSHLTPYKLPKQIELVPRLPNEV